MFCTRCWFYFRIWSINVRNTFWPVKRLRKANYHWFWKCRALWRNNPTIRNIFVSEHFSSLVWHNATTTNGSFWFHLRSVRTAAKHQHFWLYIRTAEQGVRILEHNSEPFWATKSDGYRQSVPVFHIGWRVWIYSGVRSGNTADWYCGEVCACHRE